MGLAFYLLRVHVIYTPLSADTYKVVPFTQMQCDL